MNTTLWIVTVVLAVLTFIPGIVKITQPRERLIGNMAWVQDFSQNQLRTIGTLEVAGAVGLVVPGVVGLALFLVPVAALGIALLQVGAIITHVRRHEANVVAINVIMIALSVFVAWGRLGPYPLA